MPEVTTDPVREICYELSDFIQKRTGKVYSIDAVEAALRQKTWSKEVRQPSAAAISYARTILRGTQHEDGLVVMLESETVLTHEQRRERFLQDIKLAVERRFALEPGGMQDELIGDVVGAAFHEAELEWEQRSADWEIDNG